MASCPLLSPDRRPFVGSPNSLAHARTTADGPDPGAGVMGNHYSTEPGRRGETMWAQPAFAVCPEAPVRAPRVEPPIGVVDQAQGGSLPTFFPVGNRAAATLHGNNGHYNAKNYLVVPPDRYAPQANAGGGNRRGPHDVRSIWRYAAGTVLGTRGRTAPIPVGS